MARTTTKPADPERQLKIKVKACERLSKEALYYKREAQDNETKLAGMKSSGEGNVKQQEQVLEETLTMIPHSEALLKKNLDELSAMVLQLREEDACSTSSSTAGGEWLSAARKLLEENGMGSPDGGDDAGKVEEEQEQEQEEEATKVDDLADGEAF